MGRKVLVFGQSKWPTFILKFKASLCFWDTMPCTSLPKTNAIHLNQTGFLNYWRCRLTKEAMESFNQKL